MGLVGLFVAVLIGVMAPVIGGLNSSPRSYQGVRLEPGASVPLSGQREVALDSGDSAVRLGNCLITGPGKWLRQISGASSTSSFRTGPAGDYKITCQGGAVEVEHETVGHRESGLRSDFGRRITIDMLMLAGVLALVSLGVLIGSGRAGDGRHMADGPDRAALDADEPKTR